MQRFMRGSANRPTLGSVLGDPRSGVSFMLKTACCSLLLTGALIGAPAGAAQAQDAIAGTPQNALHVLDRLGYGPRPGDLDNVQAVGVDAYIEQQLHPD